MTEFAKCEINLQYIEHLVETFAADARSHRASNIQASRGPSPNDLGGRLTFLFGAS